MAAKGQKTRRKQGSSSQHARRREHRFATSSTYIAPIIAAVGIVGSLVLGAGVFALWILDPPLSFASYLVAGGGLGLGISLWFGQPSETAVAVGDAGIAVEDGSEVIRVPWYAMKSLRIERGMMVASAAGNSVRFSVGANPKAAAWALKEAAERMPSALDVDQAAAEKLPEPSHTGGLDQPVKGDQVAGNRCANSGNAIQLEEDARLCPRCGQVYHKDSVPEACVTCEAELKGHTLRA
jgi:hypothetical protein